jgi:hypothetical protein
MTVVRVRHHGEQRGSSHGGSSWTSVHDEVWQKSFPFIAMLALSSHNAGVCCAARAESPTAFALPIMSLLLISLLLLFTVTPPRQSGYRDSPTVIPPCHQNQIEHIKHRLPPNPTPSRPRPSDLTKTGTARE